VLQCLCADRRIQHLECPCANDEVEPLGAALAPELVAAAEVDNVALIERDSRNVRNGGHESSGLREQLGAAIHACEPACGAETVSSHRHQPAISTAEVEDRLDGLKVEVIKKLAKIVHMVDISEGVRMGYEVKPCRRVVCRHVADGLVFLHTKVHSPAIGGSAQLDRACGRKGDRWSSWERAHLRKWGWCSCHDVGGRCGLLSMVLEAYV
jgi:hypothetical protein